MLAMDIRENVVSMELQAAVKPFLFSSKLVTQIKAARPAGRPAAPAAAAAASHVPYMNHT